MENVKTIKDQICEEIEKAIEANDKETALKLVRSLNHLLPTM
jgi:uncharacterized protein YpiB (UPF0302 family)